MGFYAPAQLVANAREHGVRVLPVDVNHSDVRSKLIDDPNRSGPAIRLGLQMIRGLPASVARQICDCRDADGQYVDLTDLTRRAQLSRSQIATLADADALASIASDRRAAVWQSLATDDAGVAMPLLVDLEPDCSVPEELLAMSPVEEVHRDYQTTGLSLKAHPVSFLRRQLDQLKCRPAKELPALRDGMHVRVAGMVLMRQRPSTAKGITFVTLEDETGSMNLVMFAAVWKRFFRIARASNAWIVDGKLENRKGVIHVIVGRVEDMTKMLDGLDMKTRDFR
jgi:error-prone DNA polymerase